MFTVSLAQGAFLLAQFQAIRARLLSGAGGGRQRTQSGRASNQNVITGNLGIVTTGAQAANPVNS